MISSILRGYIFIFEPKNVGGRGKKQIRKL